MINIIKNFIRNLYLYIKNVAQYSPFLWQDRDYDYIFILKLLKYKLYRTREHIASHNIIANSNEIGEQIQHAENLIDNIVKDTYCEKELLAHDEKWGDIISFTQKSNTGQIFWKPIRSKVSTDAERELEREELFAIYEKMEAQKEADMDELFKHLRNHIQKWWD